LGAGVKNFSSRTKYKILSENILIPALIISGIKTLHKFPELISLIIYTFSSVAVMSKQMVVNTHRKVSDNSVAMQK